MTSMVNRDRNQSQSSLGVEPERSRHRIGGVDYGHLGVSLSVAETRPWGARKLLSRAEDVVIVLNLGDRPGGGGAGTGQG